jgi:peptidoglycan/xylan/chitin deacetylase (PgdA/CDA1 family)
MRSVPVFMYHHINRYADDLVTLTPEGFENHLRFLSEKGFQTIFLDDLLKYLRGGRQFTRPTVALTFDDGHLDNWVYAFPLLKKYGVKATIFVVTSWMSEGAPRAQWDPDGEREQNLPRIPSHREGKEMAAAGDYEGGLRWEEARRMEESGLIDIQSHTHYHRDYFLGNNRSLRLDPLKRDTLGPDLEKSKKLIEALLHKPCRFLSWPWGKYDFQAVELAKRLGFEALATTEKGVNFPGSDEWTIKRVVTASGERKWFSQRVRIYSHRRIGQLYSRVRGIL